MKVDLLLLRVMADLQITSAHIDRTQPALYQDEFRVRLVDNRVLPIVGNDSLFNLQQIVVIDYPDVVKTPKEEVHEDKENDMDTTGSTALVGGGSPLKFEFLTLDKLKDSDSDLLNFKVSIRTITENVFPVNPIPTNLAFKVRNRLYKSDQPLFDGNIPTNSPIFFVCNATDDVRTVFLGIQKTNFICRLFNTECTGALDESGRSAILENLDRLSHIGEKQCKTHMQIAILRPRVHKMEEEMDISVDAISTLSVDYTTTEFDIAIMPPSTAHATLTFYPGWCDSRVDYDVKTRDLQLMMVMANALRKNERFDWVHAGERKKPDNQIQSEVRALIADSGSKVISKGITDEDKRYIDFTERLWEILRECRSDELLIKCLQIVLSALRSNSISTILHDDNKSNLASLIRDSCRGRPIHPPRLEGLMPIQLLLEIAVERFRRDTVTEFVKRSFVASEGDIRDMLDSSVDRVRACEWAQGGLSRAVEDTHALIPMHLGLQTISHLEGTLLQIAHRSTLAKTTKDVITRYMAKEITNFHEVHFELRVPLTQVKTEVINGMKASSFSTEIVYKRKGEEKARAHLFLAKNPPFRGLEGVLASVEEPADRYVATITKCTTYAAAKKRVKTTIGMNRKDRLNEDQNQFFGFSPMALGDEVYNAMIESWERQVDWLMQSAQWSKVKGDKKARAALSNLMFQKGSGEALTAMCDHIAEYAHTQVFNIPNNVVLPGTEPLQQMDSVDANALRQRVARAEKRVEDAKRRRALLQHEFEDVTGKLTVIRECARQLGYVNPTSPTNTTMRSNSDESSDLEDSEFHDENDENDTSDRTTEVEKMEDTVASKGAELDAAVSGDDTLTGESMEQLSMED